MFGSDYQYILQVIEHTHVVQRVDIAANQVGDFQDARTLQGIDRDQARAGVLAGRSCSGLKRAASELALKRFR